MELLYNEDGKVFVPASEFYKDFITMEAIQAYYSGKDMYYIRIGKLIENLLGSDYYTKIENSVIKEVTFILNMSYEEMDNYITLQEEREKRKKIVKSTFPKLSLVK